MSNIIGVSATAAATISSLTRTWEFTANGAAGTIGYLNSDYDINPTKVLTAQQGFGSIVSASLGLSGQFSRDTWALVSAGTGFTNYTVLTSGSLKAYYANSDWSLKTGGQGYRAGSVVQMTSPSGYNAYFYKGSKTAGDIVLIDGGIGYQAGGSVSSSVTGQPSGTTGTFGINVLTVDSNGSILTYTVETPGSLPNGDVWAMLPGAGASGAKFGRVVGDRVADNPGRIKIANLQTKNNEIELEISQDRKTLTPVDLSFSEFFSAGSISGLYATKQTNQIWKVGDKVQVVNRGRDNDEFTLSSCSRNNLGGWTGQLAGPIGPGVLPETDVGYIRNFNALQRPVSNPWMFTEFRIKGIDTPSFDHTIRCQDIEHITVTDTPFGIKYSGLPDGQNVSFISGEKYSVEVIPRDAFSTFWMQAGTASGKIGYSQSYPAGLITQYYPADSNPLTSLSPYPQVTTTLGENSTVTLPTDYGAMNTLSTSAKQRQSNVVDFYWTNNVFALAIKGSAIDYSVLNEIRITPRGGATQVISLASALFLDFGANLLVTIDNVSNPFVNGTYYEVKIN